MVKSLFSLNSYELNGTTLSKMEFCDDLTCRYNIEPSGLPPKCDGCDNDSSLHHQLNCGFGGLTIIRHNYIRDSVGSLLSLAFPNSSIKSEPLIYQGSNG